MVVPFFSKLNFGKHLKTKEGSVTIIIFNDKVNCAYDWDKWLLGGSFPYLSCSKYSSRPGHSTNLFPNFFGVAVSYIPTRFPTSGLFFIINRIFVVDSDVKGSDRKENTEY